MNRIENMFLSYADLQKSIITMPHRESFEIELCKTGYDVYRIHTGSQWNQEVKRPDNHYILPQGVIPNYIKYNLFLVPCHDYDSAMIQNIANQLQVPTIQIDDIGAIPNNQEEPFGWAKNIPEDSDKFVEYWKTILDKHARVV